MEEMWCHWGFCLCQHGNQIQTLQQPSTVYTERTNYYSIIIQPNSSFRSCILRLTERTQQRGLAVKACAHSAKKCFFLIANKGSSGGTLWGTVLSDILIKVDAAGDRKRKSFTSHAILFWFGLHCSSYTGSRQGLTLTSLRLFLYLDSLQNGSAAMLYSANNLTRLILRTDIKLYVVEMVVQWLSLHGKVPNSTIQCIFEENKSCEQKRSADSLQTEKRGLKHKVNIVFLQVFINSRFCCARE